MNDHKENSNKTVRNRRSSLLDKKFPALVMMWTIAAAVISLCSYLLFISGALRWFTDFADDRVIVICIFVFVLFLSNRIGEKLRRIEEAANELHQDGDKWFTQLGKTPPHHTPIGDQTLSAWWG